MSRWRHSCACSSGLWGRFCSQGAASLERRYERLVMNPVFVMSLVDGLIATIILSALTFVFGGLVGAALALARISPLQPVRIATGAYISFVQGIPLLVLMGLAFFGPSLLGFGQIGSA